MKSSRTRILLYTGLALLMVGLFAAIYRLNSRQHQISLTNLEIAMGKSNAQEAALLLEQIERAESQAYALFGTDRMFEVDLFRVHAGSILPACTAGIAGHSVSKEEANTAFSEERRRVDKQYHSGNIVLSLLALLATFLAIGLAATSRHQRKLNAARTQFIATVSHELRTPLSLIRLHAETLSHGRVPEGKVDDYHQTILNEAERLTGIVNNVLDFSRMERNKLNIHLEPTDVSALTEHIADTFRDRLHQEGVALERNIAKDVMGPVDPIAFSQIVLNLLDNAIKYSDDAKRIRIALDVSKDWNILTVADQGIGIPKALKKHIFNEFVRSDDRKVTARRGSGIGLSVTKRLVEKMNGTIDVADNEPKGSIFTVRLKGDDETPGG